MRITAALVNLSLLLWANTPDHASSLKLGPLKRWLFRDEPIRLGRNQGLGGGSAQPNSRYRNRREGWDPKPGVRPKTSQDSAQGRKLSRVELVLGSSGLKLLNEANVLIAGANPLAAKIITHLIRSGVGAVTVWDGDVKAAEATAREVLALNPGASVTVLHTDPLKHIAENEYATVVTANQHFDLARKFSEQFHKKANVVYACAAGAFGVVVNDFGDHRVTARSDDPYPEHQCSVIKAGNQTCLEITRGTELFHYNKGDTVVVRHRRHRGAPETGAERFRIANVDRSSKGTVKIWLEGISELGDSVVSVQRADEETELHFGRLGTTVNAALTTAPVKKFIYGLLKRSDIDRLVVGPGGGSALGPGALSVLASFIALSKANRLKPRPEGQLDDANFYHVTRGVYPEAERQTVTNFGAMKNINVPAVNSLVGALAAQEAIKGITHMFTPAELIVVDRSDAFADESGHVDEARAREAMRKVSELSFLLVGAGALGCDYLKLLAEMGVCDVVVVDNDTVDESNLTRQTLFTINDVGKPKAEAALRNLSALHNTRGFRHCNLLFGEPKFEAVRTQLKGTRTVAIAAVDNLEGRVALDNFCVQNKIPLVEAGIHGMKCSTSFTVPHLTESFAAAVGDAPVPSRHSCSARGVPLDLQDCVFYATELFAWLFNTQHKIFNGFLRDPEGAVERALATGGTYLHNLAQIVADNMDIAAASAYARDAKIAAWARKVYDKYVGFDSEHREGLVSALARLKARALADLPSPVQCDHPRFKSLVNEAFAVFDREGLRASTAHRAALLSAMDRLAANDSRASELAPLVMQEECSDCADFVHLMSNLRARKFKIPEASRTDVIRRAKNVVPAVSTCASIAVAMSLLELYKLPSLSRSELCEPVFTRRFVDNARRAAGKRQSLRPNELVLNDRVALRFHVDGHAIAFYNASKPVLAISPFDYKRHSGLSKLFGSHFLNTAALKYAAESADPPKVFTVDNENSILNGLSLSYWDHIVVKERQNSAEMPDTGAFGGHPKPPHKIHLYELVDIIEFLFDVKVDALTYNGGFVLTSPENLDKPLEELLNCGSGEIVVHLVARDNGTDKLIGLPDIKYSL